MENKSSMTALMSAFGRAYHTAVAQRPVFADTAAGELMTEEEYRMISGYILSGMDFFAPEKKGSFAGREDALRYLVHTSLVDMCMYATSVTAGHIDCGMESFCRFLKIM